jgi:hypothetical protein
MGQSAEKTAWTAEKQAGFKEKRKRELAQIAL